MSPLSLSILVRIAIGREVPTGLQFVVLCICASIIYQMTLILNNSFLARHYTQRSPTKIMQIFVRALYENEKVRLWHNKLKCLIRERYLPSLSDASFTCAKKKLIEEGTITVEKLQSKKKKALIALSEETRNRYLFGALQIPNTYLSKEQDRHRKFNKFRRLSKNRRRKEIEESGGARRERIVQYYLLRTPDTTYARRVTNRLEQGLPGLIWTYVDKNGRSYSYEDIEYTLTEEQKEDSKPRYIGHGYFPRFFSDGSCQKTRYWK